MLLVDLWIERLLSRPCVLGERLFQEAAASALPWVWKRRARERVYYMSVFLLFVSSSILNATLLKLIEGIFTSTLR